MRRIDAKILENKKVAPDVWRMTIGSSYLGGNSKPGQFVEIRCACGTEPLLRRAFGVHIIRKGGIGLLYQVVGRGTELLTKKRPGEELDILGPLGNWFGQECRAAIMVAGGVGVAPFLALAEDLKRKRRKVTVLLGDVTSRHILCEKELKKIGCNVLIATEDGSKGHRGLVTDLLKSLLRTTADESRTTIYACGPDAMSKTVANIAATHGIECQVSLGDRMACGVGVCLGCPVKVRSKITGYEYKMACKDGPVFDAKEVVW
jgi:dihydroorotate dehydrogenase electron transfer subunit